MQEYYTNGKYAVQIKQVDYVFSSRDNSNTWKMCIDTGYTTLKETQNVDADDIVCVYSLDIRVYNNSQARFEVGQDITKAFLEAYKEADSWETPHDVLSSMDINNYAIATKKDIEDTLCKVEDLVMEELEKALQGELKLYEAEYTGDVWAFEVYNILEDNSLQKMEIDDIEEYDCDLLWETHFYKEAQKLLVDKGFTPFEGEAVTETKTYLL